MASSLTEESLMENFPGISNRKARGILTVPTSAQLKMSEKVTQPAAAIFWLPICKSAANKWQGFKNIRLGLIGKSAKKN